MFLRYWLILTEWALLSLGIAACIGIEQEGFPVHECCHWQPSFGCKERLGSPRCWHCCSSLTHLPRCVGLSTIPHHVGPSSLVSAHPTTPTIQDYKWIDMTRRIRICMATFERIRNHAFLSWHENSMDWTLPLAIHLYGRINIHIPHTILVLSLLS